jgi:AraC-like DNA-binding protein
MFLLSFCLGAEMQWYDKTQESEHHVKEGQYIIYRKGQHQEIHRFCRSEQYRGITLFVSHDKIESLLGNGSCGMRHPFLCHGCSDPFDLSPKALCAIHNMMHCDYAGGLKALYMESKILELLLFCIMDEQSNTIYAKSQIALSRNDRATIQEARMLLDSMGAEDNITIASLARRCGTNECKMKAGFKELFGKTVHQYIVERRLRLALILLQQGERTIDEISQMVGYQTTSGFYKAFVKEFEFSPSEIAKGRIRQQ